MVSERVVGSLDRVLREERVHRLGVCLTEAGRPLVLEAVVADGVVPPRIESFPTCDGAIAVWGGDVSEGVVRYGTEATSGEAVRKLFARLKLGDRKRRGVLLDVVKSVRLLHEANRPYGMCAPMFVLAGADGALVFPEPLTAHVQLACCASLASCRLGLFQGQLDTWSVPPEWSRPGAAVTPASDVFQLAAWIASDSLGGSPYGPGLTMEVANRMAAGNPSALLKARNRFSSYWVDALLKGLHSDPALRFQNAGELLEALLASPEADQAESGQGLAAVVTPYEELFTAFPVEKSTWGVHTVRPGQTAEAQLLVDQMQRLRAERAATRRVPSGTSGSWGWWIAAAALVGVVGVGIWLFPGVGGSARIHEGAVSAETGGRTHSLDEATGNGLVGDTITESLLIQSIPVRVSRQLELEGASLLGELAFEPPILPPYRVRVRGVSGKESLFEFASKNRLSRVILVGAAAAQQPASYTVLYDASGEPKALMPYDPLGYPLNVQILPEAAMLPQAGK